MMQRQKTVQYSQKGRDSVNVLERLHQLQEAQGWSMYRLAKESGLTESTIANIYRRNAMPSVDTLEKICDAFGITLSQFFADGSMIEATPELQTLFDHWKVLTPEQKAAVLTLISTFVNI